MDYYQLQNEILSCLWSRDLKERIAALQFTFTEKDLLGIAFHFAPNFAERLRLLQLLVEHAPAVSDYAARCISWQKSSLEALKKAEADEVYELRIKDEPDAYEECYLCRSFQDALELIDSFRKEYDILEENPLARYVISKRKILRSADPFREDGMGECDFSAGKVLLSVDCYSEETENGPCEHNCLDCKNPCVSTFEPCFPVFLADRIPVRYRIGDGSIQYGIYLDIGHTETSESCYIIPLDGSMLESRHYDQYWECHWHEHIPCPYVEAVAVEELSPEYQERYRDFIAWLGDRGL